MKHRQSVPRGTVGWLIGLGPLCPAKHRAVGSHTLVAQDGDAQPVTSFRVQRLDRLGEMPGVPEGGRLAGRQRGEDETGFPGMSGLPCQA